MTYVNVAVRAYRTVRTYRDVRLFSLALAKRAVHDTTLIMCNSAPGSAAESCQQSKRPIAGALRKHLCLLSKRLLSREFFVLLGSSRCVVCMPSFVENFFVVSQ